VAAASSPRAGVTAPQTTTVTRRRAPARPGPGQPPSRPAGPVLNQLSLTGAVVPNDRFISDFREHSLGAKSLVVQNQPMQPAALVYIMPAVTQRAPQAGRPLKDSSSSIYVTSYNL